MLGILGTVIVVVIFLYYVIRILNAVEEATKVFRDQTELLGQIQKRLDSIGRMVFHLDERFDAEAVAKARMDKDEAQIQAWLNPEGAKTSN